ncbi:PBSX family phage terminase large subunit [Clostridium saccharobutylicum]|uniref:PBSX family phage terminase large subunit n=1 Tax=Clostridium saccharobutylicum TaxID=169679 RepID=UPI0030FF3713
MHNIVEEIVYSPNKYRETEGIKVNCNPDGPYHWFKVEYIDKLEEKNAVHLHFTMDDNFSLSNKVKDIYKKMYSGMFYKRYVSGLWCLAEGVIYDMFNEDIHKVDTINRRYEKYYVSIDYGTQNATVFLLWGLYEGKWYIVKEFYYSGRNASIQKSDVEYSKELKNFLGNIIPIKIIVDPSAASFITQLRDDGFKNVLKAKNNVLDGIRTVASALNLGIFYVNDICKETLKEFSSYIWDPKKLDYGVEEVLKEKDHCMDAMRYFVYTILRYDVESNYDDSVYEKGKGVNRLKVNDAYRKGGQIF